ncbi:hypothetical protein CYLTODRAFT_417612 [Cylindrobasidium torrendii FP15055 ss-10]|uniref:SAP domain-containing protein n=1 Tax=Cylindrobasidium torrendii FP15055 ss-10 TaxID=1314674 RepID=A0A0D7BQZ1_9AGAR|nr:hypothetical protein CYLTODRAFT_417612 [Cylindrobasidium torrendii FP15055 ss-10]
MVSKPPSTSIPPRNELEHMKRSDLQHLCKDIGVRANLKTQELIEQLLVYDSAVPASQAAQPAPQVPPQQPAPRRSSRAAPRTTSIIVHDSNSDAPTADLSLPSTHHPTASTVPVDAQPASGARTRKSYTAQTRLGVGRPKAAGGTGARAITKKAPSIAKPGKSTKALPAPMPDTIAEEVEPSSASNQVIPLGSKDDQDQDQPEAGPSNSRRVVSNPRLRQQSPPLDQRIADAVAPLQRQLNDLKIELEQYRTLQRDYAHLKKEATSWGALRADYVSLSAQMEEMRRQFSAQHQAHAIRHSSGSTVVPDVPTHLGKHGRDSPEQEEDEETPTRGILPPEKKRPRTSSFVSPRTPPNQASGSSRAATPPPMEHLPSFYTTPAPRPDKPDDGNTNPIGTGYPFHFNFTVPVPPTPDPAFSMPFSYPEPPESPTPVTMTAHTGGRVRSLGMRQQSDFLIQSLRAAAEDSNGSHEMLGPFLNEQTGSTSSSSSRPARQENADGAKRTMYGTELENDTRFGDFGFDGVDPNYWFART